MPFLVSSFGLTDYGVYLLASSVSGYMTLLDLGVGTSLVKMIAEHDAVDDRDGLGSTISTALVFYLGIGVVAALLLMALALFGVGFFRLDLASAQLAQRMFLVSAAIALFAWPASTWAYVLAGLQRYDLSARVSMVIVVGNVVATAGVLVAGEGPLTLLMVTSGVGLVGAAVNSSLALGQLRGIRISFRSASRKTARRILSFSWAIFVTQISSLLLYQQTDRIVLGVFAGPASISLYEAASKVQGLVRQLASMTASAVVPAASQMDAQQRADTLRELFLRGTKYTVAFITPITLTLIVLAEPLLREWLGPEFTSQATAARIFVSYWLLSANSAVGSSIIVGTGKVRFLLRYTLTMTLANVILSIILVQSMGILGVILGSVIPFVAAFPFFVRFISRSLELDLRDWMRRVVIPTYPWLIVPGAVSFAGLVLGLTSSLVGVGFVAALSVSAYWGCLYRFALDDKERTELRMLKTAITGKLGLG